MFGRMPTPTRKAGSAESHGSRSTRLSTADWVGSSPRRIGSTTCR
ncbi:hypothetical protein I552_9528 [Mycobacterium xenopi 3993]|nr:hypothetical protein I552_9528 [Mycobacterium xenopi 3993]